MREIGLMHVIFRQKLPNVVIKKSTLALGIKRNYTFEILIKLLLRLAKKKEKKEICTHTYVYVYARNNAVRESACTLTITRGRCAENASLSRISMHNNQSGRISLTTNRSLLLSSRSSPFLPSIR